MKVRKQLPHDYEAYLKSKLGMASEPKMMSMGGMVEDEEFDESFPDAHPDSGEEPALSNAYEEVSSSDEDLKSGFAKALKMARRFKF